jgi:hypothetical protein
LPNLQLTKPSLASFAHAFGSCVRALRDVLPPVQIVDLPAGMTCQIPGPDCLHQQHATIGSCLGATGSQGRPFAAVLATLYTLHRLLISAVVCIALRLLQCHTVMAFISSKFRFPISLFLTFNCFCYLHIKNGIQNSI